MAYCEGQWKVLDDKCLHPALITAIAVVLNPYLPLNAFTKKIRHGINGNNDAVSNV